ncbi:MAG: hypothetical protein MJ247_03875 [Alphaproteobacteria bacterium]|nr:hypothetical protein [Alphaproteobacteria bacterium]
MGGIDTSAYGLAQYMLLMDQSSIQQNMALKTMKAGQEQAQAVADIIQQSIDQAPDYTSGKGLYVNFTV